MWVANPRVFVQLNDGVDALWVIAVCSIPVCSVFCQYTGPVDDLFAPTGAAAYH